jgi:hypothetical protein
MQPAELGRQTGLIVTNGTRWRNILTSQEFRKIYSQEEYDE